MNELQERLMKLVDEIDEICKKQGLRYILGEKTAGTAVLNGKFNKDECVFNIHMPLYDAVKLKKYTLSHLSDKRAVETWAENGSLKRLMFRYVDKGTLLFDEARGEYYKYPGIAVTIHIARSERPEKKYYTAECFLMDVNMTGEEPRDLRTPFKLEGLRKRLKDEDGKEFTKRQYRWRGKDGMAALIERANEKIQTAGQSQFWHLMMTGRWRKFPDRLFEDTELIPFEGRMLPVTKHFEDYIRIVVGKTWEQRCLKKYVKLPEMAIMELDLPYEEFLEFTKDDPVSLEMMVNERKQYNVWKSQDYTTLAEKVRQDFRKVRASQVRIDLWYDLQSEKEALADAYEKGDTETLAGILDEYLMNTDKFYKDNLGFYINDTLLDYADMVWKSQGKTDYREEVYQLVPDQWKKMDLDAHLAQYLQKRS